MGNSNYFDELIVSYLSGELNAEEQSFVLEWINSSEQNKQYFEELKNTWEILAIKQTVDEIDVDSEWKKFKKSITPEQKEPRVFEAVTFNNEVVEEEIPAGNKKILQFFISTAVAASILLIVVLGWKLSARKDVAEKPLVTNNKKDIQVPAYVVRTKFNTTSKPRLFILPDGSEVKLYENSIISYQEPFADNKRDITLVGKAGFKVTKDKTKPFTVISGDLATTALGTEFTVTAYQNAKNITVRLYEGAVVIKSANDAGRKLKKEYFLSPGHELIYDTKNLTATIRTFKTHVSLILKENIKKDITPIDNPSVPILGKETWYMFNNQPLWQVFDQLELMFDVDLVYSKKDIAKSYFIGSFTINDSLDDILKQITTLNNLKVTKKNNKVIISK
jgi:transmembrane sensor